MAQHQTVSWWCNQW